MAKKSKKKGDFQKVKLKVGKKLNKPTLTDTRFKTSKITIVSRFTPTTTGNDGTSKQTTAAASHDTDDDKNCALLLHANDLRAKNACVTLRRVLTKNAAQTTPHIGAILNVVGAAVCRPGAHGKDLMALFTLICQQINEQDMRPHYELLVRRVSCALTHYDMSVRAMAIQCVHVVLSEYPLLCRRSASFTQMVIKCAEQAVKSTGVQRQRAVNMLQAFLSVMLPKSKESSTVDDNDFRPAARCGRELIMNTRQQCVYSVDLLATPRFPHRSVFDFAFMNDNREQSENIVEDSNDASSQSALTSALQDHLTSILAKLV